MNTTRSYFCRSVITKANDRSCYNMREVKATTQLVALKNIYVVARMIWCNGEDVAHRTLPLLSDQYTNRNSYIWNP